MPPTATTIRERHRRSARAGTVQAPAPIYRRNRLKNTIEFPIASYDYYRTYPYRPQQWFLSDGK